VLVPTLVSDELHGLLSCPSAPLIAGTLLRRGRPVRLAPLPRPTDPLAGGDAIMYLATCPQQDGMTAAIAAVTAPQDRLAASFARAAVEEWAAIAGNRVLLTAGSPWCAGALRAANSSRRAAAEHAGSGVAVRLLEPLALPPEAAAELASLGANKISSLADTNEGDVVVFPAHGVSAATRTEAAERGLTVVDGTCPLITTAQEMAGRLAGRGQHLVLIGQRDAAGTTSIADRAAGHITLVETAAGPSALNVSDAQRISYMLHPGMPVEVAESIADALRSRFPAAQGTGPAGLCYAASDRAASVRAVATGSDLVLVLGDAQSSDARQLSAQARETGARVQVIGAVPDVTPAMLADVATIGLAESTSASAGLSAQVIAAIAGLGQLTVARRQVSTDLVGPSPFADAQASDDTTDGDQAVDLRFAGTEPADTSPGDGEPSGSGFTAGPARPTATELAGTVR
jgi:4-hydroxy-3-methylbut-2-enyl diphosphate reductase